MSTLLQNEIFAGRYHLQNRIGVGGYSEVWLALDTRVGNLEVALKIFAPEKGLDSKGIEVFSKEYSLVFNLNHKNLLIPKHFDVVEGSPYLVMPYCSHGSVYSKIGEVTEKELALFVLQASTALKYLHEQDPPIIHQDIKPDNFLIDNNGNYLLTDFGISSKIRRTLTKSMGATASVGTLAYMPPEKFSADKQIIKAGDIFSLGVTMYELITGDLPFGDHGGMIMLTGAQIPNLSDNYSLDLSKLLKKCLSKDPWDRPTAETLIEIANNYIIKGNWNIEILPNNKQVDVNESNQKEKQKQSIRETKQIPFIELKQNDKNINSKDEIKSEKTVWLDSTKTNTLNSYNLYLKKYPSGIYQKEALKAIEDIKWMPAIINKTNIRLYEEYLKEYPHGIHANEAIELIKSIKLQHSLDAEKLWQKAKIENSLLLFKKYIDSYPDGVKYEEAKKEIKYLANIRWQKSFLYLTIIIIAYIIALLLINNYEYDINSNFSSFANDWKLISDKLIILTILALSIIGIIYYQLFKKK
ncbi:MAG: serine/threonine-protein kinase [Bacteroidales bacterium]